MCVGRKRVLHILLCGCLVVNVSWIGLSGLFGLLYESYCCCSEDEEYAGYDEHHGLIAVYEGQNDSAEHGCYYLGYADGTVEQAEVGAHLWVALEGVGQEGKGQGQHCCPCCSDEGEADEDYPLAANPIDTDKAYCSYEKAYGIGYFEIAEAGYDGGP